MAVTGKGILGWRGPKGLSAYEIALENGFVGTEKEWLSTLGTSSHFTETKDVYVTTTEDETILTLPEAYLNKDFSTLNLYINGMRILAEDYTIDETARTITLVNPITEIGTEVEFVTLT